MAAQAAAQQPTVLLRSGWQTINIGDIAHTPGVLAVIERQMPQANVILWPASIDRGVEPMLRKRFPRLRIVQGNVAPDGTPEGAELTEALRTANVFIHGSAASMGSLAQFEAWRKTTRQPYGFFGIGFTAQGEAAGVALSDRTRALATNAAFLFTRETASLANVKSAGITGPRLGFAPDGTFSCDLLDEGRATAFLAANRLEAGRFLCLIPRLRYTPYHKIRKVDWSEAELRRRVEANDRHAEPDHAKLREAAVAWVRQTGGQVLLCPEMTYETELIDPFLYDPLPADVKPRVVRHKDYWLTDEASSVYKRAALVVSLECHSPILAASHGTPCMYVHQPEDGIKGNMWPDLGLGDWYFEVEKASGAEIAARVLQIHAQPRAARAKVRQAVSRARQLQDEAMRFVRQQCTTPRA